MHSTVYSETQSDLHPVDWGLRLLRYLGLVGFLGGLAALSAIWAFGPVPQTVEQWHLLTAHIKAVFFACSFSGIVILVIVGSISWWRHREAFNRARWFRLMMLLLLITVPTCHIWARLTAEKLYETIDEGHLEHAAFLWNQLGAAYITALCSLIVIAAIGIIKPRLGQTDT